MTDRAPGRRRRVAPLVLAALAMAAVAGWVLFWIEPGIALDAWREASLLASGARTGIVEIDGERMAWAELGEGPALLLVHGLRGELTVELPLATELAERGFRVIALDLPGHGRSAAPSRPLDIARAAWLVTEVAAIRAPGERPALVGHSLGGWIVAWAALSRPERCGSVALVSPAGLPFELPPLRMLLSRTAEDAREALPLLFHDPPAFVPDPLLWVAVQRPHTASLDLLRSAVSGRYLLDGLAEALAVPAVVVFGESDTLIPPAVGRSLAAGMPRGRYAEVSGAGHMVVWERPGAVAEIVARHARETGAVPLPAGR